MTTLKGPCYPTAEALYHALGGKKAGLTPMVIEHEGIKHWYLRWDVPRSHVHPCPPAETYYIDATANQFKTPVPYEKGRGCGFLTKEPSQRSRRYLSMFKILAL